MTFKKRLMTGIITATTLAACSTQNGVRADSSQKPTSLKAQSSQSCSPDKNFVMPKGHKARASSLATLKQVFQAGAKKDYDAFMATAADPYIQHSPDMADGWQPVWDLLSDRPADFSSKKIDWLGDEGYLDAGDFLVMLREVNRGGDVPLSKIVDIMRFDEDGKYAEHWDIRQALSPSTVSGRSETGAAAEFMANPVKYSQATEKRNVKTVVRFLNAAFNKGQVDNAVDKFVDENYIQHNPMIADGAEAVKQIFASGNIPSLCYDIKYVLPQNDLVVVYSRVTSSQGVSAVVDILRVRNGKLVEHWDVVQAVPSDDKMPHKNGIF